MLRSPLFYPLNRGDAEGGGAADLQTDIMRFMAILSLCLVAIFALVQSIPLNPPAAKPEQPAAPREPVPQPTSAKSATPIPAAIPTPGERPAPTKPANSEPTPAAKTKDEPVDVTEPPTPAPPVEEGFSLQFASDAALTQLVASNEVGLYAMNATGAVRMRSSGGKYAFWPASMPNRYHEMDNRTVPADVKNALRRFGSIGRDPDLKWGVTLPTQMQGQLDRILMDHDRGELIIGADGRLRLEQ
ncbi:MAG: hypothetical protein ACR2QV_13490 [Gammaproteobacteria bacterium]